LGELIVDKNSDSLWPFCTSSLPLRALAEAAGTLAFTGAGEVRDILTKPAMSSNEGALSEWLGGTFSGVTKRGAAAGTGGGTTAIGWAVEVGGGGVRTEA